MRRLAFLAISIVSVKLILTSAVLAQDVSGEPLPAQKLTSEQVAMSSPAHVVSLSLTCIGGGSANKTDAVGGSNSTNFSGSVADSDGFGTFEGSGSSSTTIYVPRVQQFTDQTDLVIENGEGRIRVPRVMLPLIRGGEGGWFKMKNLQFGPDAITASVAINAINNPKLRIDRRTGTINLSGKAGDYIGRCQKVDAGSVERQF